MPVRPRLGETICEENRHATPKARTPAPIRDEVLVRRGAKAFFRASRGRRRNPAAREHHGRNGVVAARDQRPSKRNAQRATAAAASRAKKTAAPRAATATAARGVARCAPRNITFYVHGPPARLFFAHLPNDGASSAIARIAHTRRVLRAELVDANPCAFWPSSDSFRMTARRRRKYSTRRCARAGPRRARRPCFSATHSSRSSLLARARARVRLACLNTSTSSRVSPARRRSARACPGRVIVVKQRVVEGEGER